MTANYKRAKIGILWGGGLGDLIVIRPMILALEQGGAAAIYLFTTADHLTGIFDEMCSPARVILLSRRAGDLLKSMQHWQGRLDLVYLGPYPTLKTRILAMMFRPQRIVSRRHKYVPMFILEQIFADIRELTYDHDCSCQNLEKYLPWSLEAGPCRNIMKGKPFLVLHTSAKSRWTTTVWPEDNWRELIGKILDETGLSVVITGVKSEERRINTIIEPFTDHSRERIKPCLSMPLRETASLMSDSAGVICHNSGILHLATFLRKKTVCITGSSASYWRPPYPWVKNITSGRCDLACNRYRCPVPFFKAKCIRELSVNDVWQAAMEHLNGQN